MAAAAAICTLYTPAVKAETASGTVKIYRLYNPVSGEHFYTDDEDERAYLTVIGWKSEDVAWKSPTDGDPVYRLYNPNAGEHHYTKSEKEKDALVDLGWEDEGILFYSESETKGEPIYREYNPNEESCNHNYTSNKAEHDYLVSLGWKDEGVAFYAASETYALKAARESIVSVARTKIGAPYTTEAHVRCGPDSFDCSGFVDWVYAEAGIDENMLAREDWTNSMNEYLLDQVDNPSSSVRWMVISPDSDDDLIDWQKGDIVLFADTEEQRDSGDYYHVALVTDIESREDSLLDMIQATGDGVVEGPEYLTQKLYPYIRVFRITAV